LFTDKKGGKQTTNEPLALVLAASFTFQAIPIQGFRHKNGSVRS
jgi:hypothetical protein